MPKVLFILKHRDMYGYWNQQELASTLHDPTKSLSSGLFNSAKFIVDMLQDNGVEAKLVEVVDNNGIDKEVHNFKPDVVIIEALWVVPEKFAVLQRLHPMVQWIVRGHSDIPFLAQEGIAIDWITRYVEYDNVSFAANSEKSTYDIRSIVKKANPNWNEEYLAAKILYLPNFFPFYIQPHVRKTPNAVLDVACLGAIRPLKNQLIQAIAAMRLAGSLGKPLRFHINSTRIEKGENVLKNIRAMFKATNQELVEHEWVPREEMFNLLAQCDVGMQMSFTETFNIVAADMVVAGMPIVVSSEIEWASHFSKAGSTNSYDIAHKLKRAQDPLYRHIISALNYHGLRKYCLASKRTWLHYLEEF